MVGVGILGCGAVARKRHAPACQAHAGSEIVGFADTNVERATELATQYGTKAYLSLDAMLTDPAVNAVCVCVPERFHVDTTVRCLRAGKDVLLEKPMAMNLAESEEIARAWRESGRQLMIAFSQRFYAEHILARQLALDGEIGRIVSFRTFLSNPGAEYGVLNSGTGFYDNRLKNIGGVMLNVGCHRIDLMRYLFNAEIAEVLAYTPALDKRFSNGDLIDREDHAMVTMKLSNGIAGTMWISWCNYGGTDVDTWIFGEQGTIRTCGGKHVFLNRRDGEEIRYDLSSTQADMNGWGVVNSFLDSIAAGEKTSITGEDGLACMRVLDAIEKSHQSGSWHRV